MPSEKVPIRQEIAAYTAGIILAFVLGTASIIWSSQTQGISDPAAYILAIFLFVMTTTTTVVISSIFFFWGIIRRVGEINQHFFNLATCVYLGSAREMIGRVEARTKKATTVYNTFVLFNQIRQNELIPPPYRKKDSTRIKKLRKSALKEGKCWHDIISEAAFLQKTHENRDHVQHLFHRYPESYSCRMLTTEYPIVNFIIFEYTDNDAEVLFGWGHHPHDRDGYVFSSKDRHIIEYFRRFWKTLEDDSVRTERIDPRRLDASDIKGWWCTLSWEDKDRNKERDIVIARINFDGRKISIEAEIYGCHGEPKGDIQTRATAIEGEKLWFAYEVRFFDKPEEYRLGAANYTFFKSKNGITRARGYFYDQRSEEKPFEGRRYIDGMRVPVKEIEMIERLAVNERGKYAIKFAEIIRRECKEKASGNRSESGIKALLAPK